MALTPTSPTVQATPRQAGMSLPLINTLKTFIRTQVSTAASLGTHRWMGIRLDKEPTQEQIRCLNRIGMDWAQKIASNCKIDIDMEMIEKKLIVEKEIAKDGSFNPDNLARRFTAYYATFNLLSTVTNYKGVPKPKNMEELVSLSSKVCDAFYAVIKDEYFNNIPAETALDVQNIIFNSFIELKTHG